MKTKMIYVFLMSLFLLGCQKEDGLSPSYADPDWFSVEDDPNNALTHLRYLIYTEQGVPIFYNDTLGSEIRYDRDGNPFTYYEVLKPGYTVSGRGNPKYVLSDDETDIRDMVELMNEYLFDYLPKERRPLSYLLVDTIFFSSDSRFLPDAYYRSLTTTCVGRLKEVKLLNDSARKSAMAELAGLQFVDDILNAEVNKSLIVQYDSVILKVNLKSTEYTPNQFNYENSKATSVNRKVPEAELFGLLRYRYREANRLLTPTKQQDKASFVGLILSCTDEEIRKRYKDYPEVIKKYEMMREMLKNLGVLEE